MKKFWLISSLIFAIGFVILAGLSFFTQEVNPIGLFVFALITLSGFAVSYANFVFEKTGVSNRFLLLFSVLTFLSTLYSFYDQPWFEMSWNFNLAGHVFLCGYALFKTINQTRDGFVQLIRLLLILLLATLIIVLLFKVGNPLIIRILGGIIVGVALTITLTQTLSKVE